MANPHRAGTYAFDVQFKQGDWWDHNTDSGAGVNVWLGNVLTDVPTAAPP